MVTIQHPSESDIPTIVRFNAAMARETEGLDLDLDRLTRGVRAVLDDPAKGFYLVAMLGDEVIAQLMVTFEWSDWRNGTFWWIQSVYVHPPHRGKGVFQSLYHHLESMAASQGNICGLRLYVELDNERAQRVYARLGMVTTHYRMLEVDSVLSARTPASEPSSTASGSSS